ncbi:MAG TPA: APC family permease [Candidatus Limnocylindrales bacterium]|nr:APC family permease [Candidatus Limnocylindrales bacterium]
MATGTAAPPRQTLFLRNATGLVKAWSGFDAFIYSFMSVNLVALGFGAFASAGFIANGHILSAVIIAGIFVTFLVLTYAILVAAMPRAGGDYTWQSRVLGGGAAFVLSMTGWWFILWHWTPIYAAILNQQVLAPLSATIGRTDWATFFSPTTGTGLFVACLVVLAFVCVYVTMGMEGYAKIQKFCFWLGLAGLAVMAVLLLVNDQTSMQNAINREATSIFGYQGNAYQDTLKVATKAGYSVTGFNAFSFGPTLALVPFLLFYLLWPVWGATLYGEVRGTKDYRRIFNSMFWGLWVTVILSVVVLLLLAKTIGWEFFQAAAYNATFGVANAPIPIWPHPVMLTGWLVHNHAFQFILLAVMSVWFWGWSGTLFLSSTRVIFAAAFDRVLPEWAANISAKRRVPYGALILMVVPALVISAIYAYVNGFSTLVLDATLVIAITYLGTVVAAAILPWRRPTIFTNSPIAKLRVGGVPVITVGAAVAGVFLIFNIVKWLADPTYGIGLSNPKSMWYLAAMYVLALVVYVAAFLYRRSQGIDLRAIHHEIPVE